MAGSFLRGRGSSFPQQNVVIIHSAGTAEEQRTPSRAVVQAQSGFFDFDTSIYEGDVVELDDPRGGKRCLYVTRVDINDVRGSGHFRGMSHIQAHWSSQQPAQDRGTATYNGPVVNVHGDHAQLAWGNQSVVQNTAHGDITAGYEDLAVAVTNALKFLTTRATINEEDRAIAQESADEALTEMVTEEPDQSRLRRSVATLRGLLASSLATATDAAATEGITALIGALNIT